MYENKGRKRFAGSKRERESEIEWTSAMFLPSKGSKPCLIQLNQINVTPLKIYVMDGDRWSIEWESQVIGRAKWQKSCIMSVWMFWCVENNEKYHLPFSSPSFECSVCAWFRCCCCCCCCCLFIISYIKISWRSLSQRNLLQHTQSSILHIYNSNSVVAQFRMCDILATREDTK